jgi:acetolactate synthase-1/2/3 large subunit
MARMTGGGALVEMLRRHDVDTIFALPGVQNDALFVAFYDTGEALRVIHTRHEQGGPLTWPSGMPARAARSAPMP